MPSSVGLFAAGAALDASTALSDPWGDTNGVQAFLAQTRTVDIVRVTYAVVKKRVVIRTRPLTSPRRWAASSSSRTSRSMAVRWRC